MSTTNATTENRVHLVNVPPELWSEVPERARYAPRNREEHAEIMATWDGIELRNDNADFKNRPLANLCIRARHALILWLNGYSAGLSLAIDTINGKTTSNPTACGNGASTEPGVIGSSESPMSAAHG